MKKHSAPPEHPAKLKDLSNAPLPDLKTHQAAINHRVQVRRRLEDQFLEKQLEAKNRGFAG